LLELVSSREFPGGNDACGYEMMLPLAPDCRLDLSAWERQRYGNGVRRFWLQQKEQHGRLRHDQDGWFLVFGHGENTDEAVFQSNRESATAGSRVAITEFDGQTRVYRVVALAPAA
jgi:hypothetical protein